jgi:hypothetical protein
MTTKRLEAFRGPNGIKIELDRGEVYTDDPGAGTPAVVMLTKDHRTYFATYWCAIGEGCLDGTGGDSCKLSKTQLQWLESMESEVEDFLYN